MEERDFFSEPLAREELEAIASRTSVDEIFSWNSPRAKPYRDRRGQIPEDELIELMLQEPRLIRRPILVLSDRVLVGYRAKEYQQTLGLDAG